MRYSSGRINYFSYSDRNTEHFKVQDAKTNFHAEFKITNDPQLGIKKIKLIQIQAMKLKKKCEKCSIADVTYNKNKILVFSDQCTHNEIWCKKIKAFLYISKPK